MRGLPRPTSRGWQAIVIGALLIAGARALGTTQLYQLGYVLLALLPLSLILGLYGGRGVRVRRRFLPDGMVSVGEPADAELRLEGNPRLPGMSFEILDHLSERVVAGSALDGRTFRVPVSFPERGSYAVGPVEVLFQDPFGLLIFPRDAGERREILVYPRLRELEELGLQGGGGESRGSPAFVRRGEEFSGLREYRRGDEPRHIHWKSVARTGELHVREFASESPPRHTVFLDLSSPEHEEWAVSVAGSALYQLLQKGLVFRLVCNGTGAGETGFGEDRESFRRAMGLLAVAEACEDGRDGLVPGPSSRGGSFGESAIVVAGGDPPVQSVLRLRRAGDAVTVLTASTDGVEALEDAGAHVVCSAEGVRA